MKQNQTNDTKTNIKTYEDVLGIRDLAQAKDKTELVTAYEKTRSILQEAFDNLALNTLQDIAKEIDTGTSDEKSNEKFLERYQEVEMLQGMINGKVVEGSVSNWHQKHVIKLRKQLITEHQASSASECMIIDLAINAYFRSLHASRIYSCLEQNKDGTISFDQPRVNMLKELGKQIDSANRQYISTLTLLKEMKQPQINIKVQSKQAFVSQNQQFNKNA